MKILKIHVIKTLQENVQQDTLYLITDSSLKGENFLGIKTHIKTLQENKKDINVKISLNLIAEYIVQFAKQHSYTRVVLIGEEQFLKPLRSILINNDLK